MGIILDSTKGTSKWWTNWWMGNSCSIFNTSYCINSIDCRKFIKGKPTGLHLPLIGLFFGGGIACYANSFLFTDLMRVFILFYLMPVWTTIFEIIFFKQKPKWQRGGKSFFSFIRPMDCVWSRW